MQIKQFLRQCRQERIEIDILRERQAFLRASLLPAAVRPKEVDVQTSGSGDRVSGTLAEVADLDVLIDQKLRELLMHRRQALQVVFALKDSAQRQVLELYYLSDEDLSWSKVAVRMHYSERSIYSLHGLALLEAEKVCSELQSDPMI